MHRPLPDEIYGDIVAYNGCEGLCNVEPPPLRTFYSEISQWNTAGLRRVARGVISPAVQLGTSAIAQKKRKQKKKIDTIYLADIS